MLHLVYSIICCIYQSLSLGEGFLGVLEWTGDNEIGREEREKT